MDVETVPTSSVLLQPRSSQTSPNANSSELNPPPRRIYTIDEIQRRIARHEEAIRESDISGVETAVLKGIMWSTEFVKDDGNFHFIFSDYLMMLHELSLQRKNRFVVDISLSLIDNAARRSVSRPGRLGKIFKHNVSGCLDFISVLCIFSDCAVSELGVYLSHYRDHYENDKLLLGSDFARYWKRFYRKLREVDFDALTDYCVDYAFVDYFEELMRESSAATSPSENHPTKPCCPSLIRLPRNRFQEVMIECAKVDLFHFNKNSEDEFHDQNYFVTHLVCAQTIYGRREMPEGPFSERQYQYLLENAPVILNETSDVDLIGELLQCFKIFAREESREFIQKCIKALVSLQKDDGCWEDDPEEWGENEDAYDEFHPVWTSTVALHIETPSLK